MGLLILFTNPSARAGYDTRSIFKRSLTGLNSEFSFSLTSCLTKAEEPSLSYYLPIAGGRIFGFIPFPRVLVLCEMQSVSSMIWTRVAVSISNDDNDYTTGTSSIGPIDRALSGAITLRQSGPANKGNDRVFRILQSPSITRVSPSGCLMFIQESGWVGVLVLGRDVVAISLSPSQVGCNNNCLITDAISSAFSFEDYIITRNCTYLSLSLSLSLYTHMLWANEHGIHSSMAK